MTLAALHQLTKMQIVYFKILRYSLVKASVHQGENQPVGASKVRKPEINATIAKM